MGYLNKTEYEIVPDGSFTVIRSCGGCHKKSRFGNTGKFRVNANGSLLDVWLLYGCEECGHTLKLTVYERQKRDLIPEEEYSRFLENDEALAAELGRSLPLFKKNKAEVELRNLNCSYVKIGESSDESVSEGQKCIDIHNPCGIKLRPEKQMAEVMGISASRVKKLIGQGEIVLKESTAQLVSFLIRESEIS